MKATLTNGIVVEGTPEELERFLQLQATTAPSPTTTTKPPAPVTPAKPTTLPQTSAPTKPAPAKAVGAAATLGTKPTT